MNATEAKTKSTPTTNYDDGCTPSYDASNALYDGVFVTTCTSTFAYDTPAQPSCNADQAIVITPLLLTAISGTGSLACDNNGNMTTDDQGHTLVYDAWNRLVEVKDASGFLLHAYSYDGLGRRITVSDGYTVTDDYYTTSAQLIQENVGTNVTATYLWSTFYVDGLLCRSSSSSGSYLATFDANYNVTSMYSTGGTTQERFLYSPFGARTVLNASWSGTSETKNWTVGFEGLFLDTAVGMYYARNRWYSPSLMRWISWDPTGYSDGLDPNVAYADNPINRRDPSGQITVRFVSETPVDKGKYQVEWNFLLDNPAPPGGGYIVQKVTIVAHIFEPIGGRFIDVGSRQKPGSYYEAWFVEAGHRMPRALLVGSGAIGPGPIVSSSTDAATGLTAYPGSKGKTTQDGEIRFYTKCPKLGDLTRREAFPPDPASGFAYNSVLEAPDMPATENEPDFWKKGPENNGERVGHRSVIVEWNDVAGDKNFNGKNGFPEVTSSD